MLAPVRLPTTAGCAASLLCGVHDPGARSARAHRVRAVLDVRRLTSAPSNSLGPIVDLDDLKLVLRTIQIERRARMELLEGGPAAREPHDQASEDENAHAVDASQVAPDGGALN